MRRSWPAIFTTQPPGARLPFRMTRPPLGSSGRSSGLTTHLAPRLDRARHFLGKAVPGWRERGAVDEPRRHEPLRDDAAAARLAEVDRREPAARLEVGPQWACGGSRDRNRRS